MKSRVSRRVHRSPSRRLSLEPLEPRVLLSLSGMLVQDALWAGVVEVDGDVTIAKGASVAVVPGTVVKVGEGATVTVEGSLFARGSRSNPVVFTSWRDDGAGGDTNGDGLSVGMPGDWGGLVLGDSGRWTLEQVGVRFASMTPAGIDPRIRPSGVATTGGPHPASTAFPTPLPAQGLGGALVYENSLSETFDVPGEMDDYTLDVDAGQTLTILVTPGDPGLEVGIELFGTGGGSLGTASAPGAGEPVVLQTRAAGTDGQYRVELTSAGGSGAYDVRVVLNAALEEEPLDGVGNDTTGAAQGIDGSAVDLQGDGGRMAVVGQLEGGGADVFEFHLDVADRATLGLFLEDGDDPFPLANYDVGHQPGAVALGDIDGDLYLDVITIVVDDSDWPALYGVVVLENQGNGTFGAPRVVADLSAKPTQLAVGDLEGDGDLDIVVGVADDGVWPPDGAVAVVVGDGTGTFGAPSELPLSGTPGGIALGDMDGGNGLDIVVSSTLVTDEGDSFGRVSVFVGDGAGGFGAPGEVALAHEMPGAVALGDLDGDTHLDVVVSNGGTGWGMDSVSVLLGDGTGKLSVEQEFGTVDIPSDIALGDVNGDGRPDLVTANQAGWGGDVRTVSVLLGTGAGGFACPTVFEVGHAPPVAVALGDVNGDGVVDVVTADGADVFGTGWTSGVSVLTGANNGMFSYQGDLRTDLGPTDVALGDVNGDGKLDIVTSNAGMDEAWEFVADVSVLRTRPPVTLELLDTAGAVVAQGIEGDWGRLDEWIQGCAAPLTGSYFARVSGGEAGQDYALLVVRNADVELPGSARDPYAAQDITRAGQVVGNLSGSAADDVLLVAGEDFESGVLGGEWATWSSDEQGRIEVTGAYGAAGGDYALVMDRIYVAGDRTLNEAVWTVDLSGLTDAELRFTHVEFDDWEHPFSGAFGDHANADGIAISADGGQWEPAWNAADQPQGKWQPYSIDLGDVVAAAGGSFTSSFQIRLQQYDLREVPWDGRAWDGMAIVTPGDLYSVAAEAGDVLLLTVTTPGDGGGEPANDLVPRLIVVDEIGSVVGEDTDLDGSLTVPIATSGTYTIEVQPDSGSGDYVLSVDGAGGDGEGAFEVVASSPADGDLVSGFPETYVVDFSQPLRLTSVDVDDLRVDGQPATAVTVVDGDTLEFQIAGLGGDGHHDVAIFADTVVSLWGHPVQAFAASFDSEGTPPIVSSIAPPLADGSAVDPGDVAWQFTFSEPLETADLGAEDVMLTNTLAGMAYTPATFAYDPGTGTLDLGYTDLTEGSYTLRLVSSPTGFRDLGGTLLDGNADGVAGDSFEVHFAVDPAAPAVPTPLQVALPHGAQTYGAPTGDWRLGAVQGVFHGTGDVDAFTIDLDAGQSLAAVLEAWVPGVDLRLEVFDPEGVSLGSTVAAGTASGVVQPVAVVEAGTYTLAAESLAGAGSYGLRLVLNAELEEEYFLDGAPANDALADAQPLSPLGVDGHFAVLGSVNGAAGADAVDFYAFDLAAGDVVSLVAAGYNEGREVDIALLDGAGTMVALGVENATGDVDDAISGFTAAAPGTWFVRVVAEPGDWYTLDVTRDRDFDLEANDTPDAAQQLQVGEGVQGFLDDPGLSVEPDDFAEGTVLDHAVPGVTLSVLYGGPTDQVQAVASFRASTGSLVFGHNGDDLWNFPSEALGIELDQPVAYLSVDVVGSVADQHAFIQFYDSDGNPIDVVSTPDEMTAGQTYTLACSLGVPEIAAAIVSGSPCGGKHVAIDNLVAGRDQADVYRFDVPDGSLVQLTTATPGDGAGEPLNDLDPQIAVYDGGGGLVAQDDNGVGDGRNASTSFTANPGPYTVAVTGTGRGDYTLAIAGATLVNPTAVVTGTTPEVGSAIVNLPGTFDFSFSEGIRGDLLDPSALTINGVTATAAELVEGSTVRFTVPLADLEGPYTYDLAAGAAADLQGQPNEPFTGSFLVDRVAPTVVAHTANFNAPFSAITFTFSEAIDPASVDGWDDVASFLGPGGTNLWPAITEAVVVGDQLTIRFPEQAAGGEYVMVIGPDIEDFAGHPMDQNGNGTAGEAEDTYRAEISLGLPDLVVESVVPAPPAIFGSALEVSWRVRNAGDEPATDGWSDALYLSRDNVLDLGDDVALGAFEADAALLPLAADGFYDVTQTVDLPLDPDWLDGVFFILVRTDDAATQPEGSEGNNVTASDPLDIALPPLPDLVISDVAAPATAFSGETIPITYTLTNQGTGDATATVTERYFLTQDPAGAGYHLCDGDFTHTGTVQAGESVTIYREIQLEPVMEGDWYLTVVADTGLSVYEHANEHNNRTTDDQPVVITQSGSPNLVVTDIDVPAEAWSGEPITIEFTVENTGSAPTAVPVWHDSILLSDDDQLDFSDPQHVFLADYWQRHVDNSAYLNPGESYLTQATFTVPRGMDGQFYVIVHADMTFVPVGGLPSWTDHVEERDHEDDNWMAEAFQVNLTPPPDLQVTAVSAPAVVFSGQEMLISYTVTNEGDGHTVGEHWEDFIVLSEDTVYDGSDIYLGKNVVNAPLAAGAFYSVVDKPLTPPIEMSGDYYLLVVTDVMGHIFEFAHEDNNTGASTDPIEIVLTPPPDLEVLAFDAPDEALSGRDAQFSYSVANYGATDTLDWSLSWLDAVYLSEDTTLDPETDILVGTEPHIGALAAGQTYSEPSVTLRLPAGLSGAYYAFFVTDQSERVLELDTDNNVAMDPVAITVTYPMADLVVLEPEAPGAADAGTSILGSFRVANQGDGDTMVTHWSSLAYLSADNVLDIVGDTPIGVHQQKSALEPGASFPVRNMAMDIPSCMAAGDYFLFFVTDPDDAVPEHDNANNATDPLPITISLETADLQVTAVATVPFALTTEGIEVTWRVDNLGTARTNSSTWVDAVYISMDTVVDPLDQQIGTVSHGGKINPGSHYDVTEVFELPPVEGAFYVIVRTDAHYGVLEDLEGNNDRPSDATCVISMGELPDLAVLNVDAPPEALSGRTLTIEYTVRNEGGGGNYWSWSDSVFLSKDQVLGDDHYLGHVQIDGPILPDAEYTMTEEFEIPEGLAGPYYVIVFADYSGRISEPWPRVNNKGYDPEPVDVQFTAPADLVAGPITVPANAAPGDQVTLAFTVYNQGENPARGPWDDSLYLSADTTWDIDDPFLGQVRHQDDVPGPGSYSDTLTAPLPGVVPGDYYVIIRSDIRNRIAEFNEENNLGASLDQVAIDVEELVLGVPDADAIAQGQAVYYRFEGVAGTTVKLTFDAADDTSAQEIAARYGQLPSPTHFDAAQLEPFVADPVLMVPIEHTGTHYVMVRSQVAAAQTAYTITAEVVPFTILSVEPGTVGDWGEVTVAVDGALFEPDMAFELVLSADETLAATRTVVADSVSALVTFNTGFADPGTYALRGTLAGGEVAELADAIVVSDGLGGPHVAVSILGQSPVVQAYPYLMQLGWMNDGGADTLAPLLVLDSLAGAPVAFDLADIMGFRGHMGEVDYPMQMHLVGTPSEGLPDVLRPTDPQSQYLWFISGLLVGDHTQEEFEVHTITAEDARPITDEDWGAIEAAVRPLNISDEAWDPFWTSNQPRIGDTWGDYVVFLNQVMVDVSPPGEPFRDVRAMFTALVGENADYLVSSTLAGQVLDSQTGLPLAEAVVAAYEETESTYVLADATITDEDGYFTLDNLTADAYSLALDDYDWDTDRDGALDTSAPEVAIPEDTDVQGVVLYAMEPMPVQPTTLSSDAALAVDADGVAHIIWSRDGCIWHAWHDGSEWVDATRISTTSGHELSLEAGATVIDGTDPGLVASWSEGSRNDTEIVYAAARPAADGGYEWANPVRMTHNAVRDAAPALALTGDGTPLVVYLTSDYDIQDDDDLYFQTIDVDSGLFPVATEAVVGPLAVDPLGIGTGSTASFAFTMDWRYGAYANVRAGYEIKGEAAQKKCSLEASASASAFISIRGTDDAATFKGTGAASASWQAEPQYCYWDFQEGTLKGSVTAIYDYKNALLRVLGWIPATAPAAKSIGLGIKKAQQYIPGLEISNGMEFQLTMEGSAGWKTQAPFPTWVKPDSVKFGLKGQLGPYAAAGLKGIGEVKVTGFVTLGGDIYPVPQFTELSGTGAVSVTFYGFVFERTWSVGYYGGGTGVEDLGVAASDGEDEWVYDPARSVGTGNIYGTNAVLASVDTDLWRDGAPSLATLPSGNVLATWFKTADPYAVQMGSEIAVAEFDGSAWSAPTILPDSLGITSEATIAVDGSGAPVVVWSMGDSSSLSDVSTTAEIDAAMNATDVVYSVFDGAAWTSPAPIATLAGSDREIAVETLADGRVLLTWVNLQEGMDCQLLASFWDGAAWSTPEVVATAVGLAEPAIGATGGEPVVFWTQATSADETTSDAFLQSSTYSGGAWAAPVLFEPQAAAEAAAAAALVSATASGDIEPLGDENMPSDTLFGYEVPKQKCCKCMTSEDMFKPECNPGGGYSPAIAASLDPNDILGPEGFGPDHWIPAAEPIAYTVRCENDAEWAAAYVHHLRITQQLDDDLDFRTFRVGDFGFGDIRIDVPDGQAFYSTRLDATDTHGVYIDVAIGVDVATGEAFWQLDAIDPETGQAPSDPLKGILPPNVEPPEGDAWFNYSVSAEADATSGTVVDAMATIFFDINPPIDTPTIFNTLDAGLPTSAMGALPPVSDDSTFMVSWDGADDPDGSGLATFDILVSTNGGTPRLWRDDTELTGAMFAGTAGDTYAFYAVATDHAGNEQEMPEVPQAQTAITGGVASLGDRVWLDADADGIQDPGEPGIPDVQVALYASDGTLLDSRATDATGFYRFTDLEPGLQGYLEFTAPEGHLFSPTDRGIDDAADSDADPATGRTPLFALYEGSNAQWDAGLYQLAEISGILWNDADSDGENDATEGPLAGWTVFLDADLDGALGGSERSTLTEADGSYLFDNLIPGTYVVREIVPEGWVQTYPGSGGTSDDLDETEPVRLAFHDAGLIEAGGAPILVGSYSVPSVADWNNDGRPDLLVGEKANGDGKIRVYLNQGEAGAPVFDAFSYVQAGGADLAVPASGCLGVFPRALDWDGDGRKDLLLGLADGTVQAYLNVGTDAEPAFDTGAAVQYGQPGSKADISVGGRATLDVADWNADGTPDLIVGALDGGVRVYLNEAVAGIPDLRTEMAVQDGGSALVVPSARSSPVFTDLDGDGLPDLVVGNTDGELILYPNVGTPAVPAFDGYQRIEADGSPILIGTERSRPFVADHDLDGLDDILVGGADGLVRLYTRTVETTGVLATAYTTTGSAAPIYAPGETIDALGTPQAAELIGLDALADDPRFAHLDGSGFAVAVIDTGIDLDHPFFGPDADGDGVADRIVYQYDFAEHDTDASDPTGHGSHVTSIIASSDAAYPGIVPGVDVVFLKIFTDEGTGSFGGVEQALQWVLQNAEAYNIAAVNLSFGDGGNWQTASWHYGIGDELAALATGNVIVVSSAGNSYGTLGGATGLAYPAADPAVIAVGAVWDADRGGPWEFAPRTIDYSTAPDRIASFSQRDGGLTDVFAPGALITGANATGGIAAMRGTSQAAPYVTGAAVLAQQIAIEQLGRAITPYEFRTLLADTGVTIVDGDDEDDSVPNTGLTFPRLDVAALAEGIATLDPLNPDPGPGYDGGSGQWGGDGGTQVHALPFAHTIALASGDARGDVHFGNQRVIAPPADLAIVPDTGLSDSDGVTNQGTLALTGALGETGLSVHLYDETTGTDLGDGFVVGAAFGAPLSLAAGDHHIRAIADDGQGNTSEPAWIDVLVDLAPPDCTLDAPLAGSIVLADPGCIDILWADPNASGLDESTFGIDDLTITTAGQPLSVDRIEHLGGGLVRYIYADDSDALVPGQVDVTMRPDAVSDVAGNTSQQHTESFAFAPPGGEGPIVVSTVLDDGTPQRSMVRSITVAFDADVTIFTDGVDDFAAGAELLLIGPAGVATQLVAYDPATATATWAFDADGDSIFGDSLPDGDWTAILDCSLITNEAGDPLQDTDGNPGDGLLTIATFHRLFGDSDGDRDADGSDYSRFRAAYFAWSQSGTLDSILDFDQDGDVDGDDFAALRGNLGRIL